MNKLDSHSNVNREKERLHNVKADSAKRFIIMPGTGEAVLHVCLKSGALQINILFSAQNQKGKFVIFPEGVTDILCFYFK